MESDGGRQGEWDDGADEGYRSLSGLAVAGLVLGLCSPVCFAGQVLVFVPILAVLVTSAAIRKVAANPEVLTGRWVATAGLMLAVATLAALTARGVAVRRLIAEEAEPVARTWIDKVRSGRVEEAFRLTWRPGEEPEPPRQLANRAPVRAPLDVYAEHDAVRFLGQVGEGAVIRRRHSSPPIPSGRGTVQVHQRYEVTASGGAPRRVSLLLERTSAGGGRIAGWRVVSDALDPADG